MIQLSVDIHLSRLARQQEFSVYLNMETEVLHSSACRLPKCRSYHVCKHAVLLAKVTYDMSKMNLLCCTVISWPHSLGFRGQKHHNSGYLLVQLWDLLQHAPFTNLDRQWGMGAPRHVGTESLVCHSNGELKIKSLHSVHLSFLVQLDILKLKL